MRQNHILVVDDDKLTRHTFKLILKNDYREIITASNGEEALDIIQEYKKKHFEFLMVITDYKMPKMNGYELVKSLGNPPPIPIIMVTEEMVLKEEVIQSGLYELLSKPCDANYLKRLIEEIERERSLKYTS